MKVKVCSPDANTDFDIVVGVLQGDTWAPYLFIICLDYVLRTSIDLIKENGFTIKKARDRQYPAEIITDADYANDIVLLSNTPAQAKSLLHSLEQAAVGIKLNMNANKMEYTCFKWEGTISTLSDGPLKLADKFVFHGSCVSSTKSDVNMHQAKTWTAINRLSDIWNSDLSDKITWNFYQAVFVSVLLYGWIIWTLTKDIEKKLDENWTKMQWAILNQSWKQHPTKQQLYDHLLPISKAIQVRWTRYAGHCWRSKDKLISNVILWTPTYGYVSVGQKQWMIGMNKEKESGKSVLSAWLDDDDDDDDEEEEEEDFLFPFNIYLSLQILHNISFIVLI